MSFSTDGVKFTHRPRKANLFFGFFVKITEAVLSVLFIITLAAPFGFPNQADAALGVSSVLSYQGRLTGNTGSPLGGGSPGTTYCMRFSLYTAASAGSALWPVSGTATTTTPIVIDGVFNVDIPDANTFDFSTNNTPYLNVEVYNVSGASCTGGSWETLAPRQRVDAVAYARVAENVYSTLLKTDNANNRVQIGETGTNPTLLLLGVRNTTDYIGDTCSVNGTVWFNSGSSRGLICESLHLKALSNATSTLDAVVPAGNLSVGATTISSGSVTLAGGANITLSQAGNALTIIGGAGGAGLGGIAVSGIATTFTSGTVVFSGGNLMSVSTAAQAVIINNVLSSSGIAQDVASVSNAGTLSSRFALADHAHRGIGMFQISGGNTSNTSNIVYGSLAFAGGNNITLSQVSGVGGATVTIVGAAGGAAGSNTFGMSNLGNTSGTSGTVNGSAVQVLFAGGNNITLSQSIGNGGNSVNATITVSGVSFSNANNFTFGLNAGTLTASYSQSVQTQNLHNLTISSNTAGVGAAISSGTLALAGGANITLSQNGGNTITIIGAAGGGGGVTLSQWEPYLLATSTAVSSLAPASIWFNTINLPDAVAISKINLVKSFNFGVPAATSAASSGTNGWSYSQGVSIFTRQDYGANSTNLSYLTSGSAGLTYRLSWTGANESLSVSWVTNSTGGTSSWSTASGGAAYSSYWTGLKYFRIPLVTTLTAGEYWMGYRQSSSSASVGNSNITIGSLSHVHVTFPAMSLGNFGSAGYISGWAPGKQGVGYASAFTTNNTMAMSVISSASQQFQYFNFVNF